MTTKVSTTCKDGSCTTTRNYAVRPRARVYEQDDNYYLDIEMPGISEADAEITLYRNDLRIAGESEDLEFRYERRFRLPDTVNADGVTATMQLGILNVVLPKSEEAKPKTIKVLAG